MKNTMIRKSSFTLLLLLTVNLLYSQQLDKSNNYYLNFETLTSLQDFFSYKNNEEPIIVSAHRGGKLKGFPENSLEGFKNLVGQMQLIFEIDPRLTKDSVIVLMHDETLDRTTNAKGKLAEYTWAELQNVRLKDAYGNVTDFKIPLLEEVIRWGKGKTILNLDKKDVPFDMIVDIIKRNNAEKSMMITVHTGAQARYYYDRMPGIMFSAFMTNNKEYEDMSIAGVPWENMIAYVGRTIHDDNRHIVEKLHGHGVKCMVSFAPTHDKLDTPEKRKKEYQEEIKKKPDIIESDIPTEVWTLIR